MTLFIRLLGPVDISSDQVSLSLKGYKPLALLAYLLLTDKAQTREHLVDLLYDEADDPRASLRWTLNQLRQGIGSDYLEADRQQIGFNFESDYWLDVEAFLSGQTGLYRGEFLEGLYLRDAPRFMDWAFFERERLRKNYQESLASQLVESERRSDYQAVLETGHQLLRSDHLREEGYRALMQAYTLLGQREAALAQYEICRRLLGQELGVEPDEETIVLYKQIQSGALAGSKKLANLPVPRPIFEEVTVPSSSHKREEVSMKELVGRTLGPYRLMEQIGQGGMATVFKAYQPSLDRSVALKILPPLLARQPGFVERFEREAKAIAKLNHPNILPVFDFGQAGAYSFLVMRYIEDATTLKEVMKQPLSLSQVADLISQVAAALDNAHGQGIIHRDVKPSNVLMAGNWVLLSDFGLAKMVETSVKLTGTGVGLGTPAYMSPEQAQGQPVDRRTDIYALGIILFEMLTGEIPHNAETPFAIILKRATEPLPLPRLLNPEIPELVERVILKALALDPNDRFDNAGALAEALKTAASESNLGIVQPAIVSAPSSQPSPPSGLTQAMATPLEPNQGLQQKVANFFNGDRTEQQAQRNRQAMLKLVYDFWVKGVLENSLYRAVRLELGLKAQARAVEQPWAMIIQTPQVSSLFLPPGTRISEVFSAMGEALLILGEPGSGKTTMLLELAREKIAQAEANPTQPLPVVFNLSSWEPRATRSTKLGHSFEAWLVAELNSKYYLPEKIARPWVENDELLLLLDGLDEVAPERREACVQAINEFRQKHLVPIVICSRLADYELLTTKLKLHGAVLIQPLAPQQVKAYLAEAGPELAAVRELLQHDEPLQELAQSPLLLSTMTLAYRGLPVAELPALGSVEARRRHLFETYTRRMFERRGVDERYSPAETIHWLTQIAQKMSAHSQSILMIERLQPTWMSDKSSRWLYTIGYGAFTWLIAALLIGLNWMVVVGLLHWLGGGGSRAIWDSLIFGLRAGFWLGLAVLVSVALWVRSGGKGRIESINPIEALRWSWSGLRNSLFPKFSKPDIIALGTVIFLLLLSYALFRQYWCIFGLISLFLGPLLVRLVVQSRRGSINLVEILKEFWVSLRNSWKSPRQDPEKDLVQLRLYIAFGVLIVGSLIGYAMNPQGWWLLTLSAVIAASLFLLSAGLNTVEIEMKVVPNQGIWQSARNAILIAVIAGLGFGLSLMPFAVGIGISMVSEYGRWLGWVTGMLTFLALGGAYGGLAAVIGGLWYGGLAVIQHFVLRFMLYLRGDMPWNLARFLDYAAERIFLQKVGGGYIFIHRLLLEYFASLDRNDIQQLTQDL